MLVWCIIIYTFHILIDYTVIVMICSSWFNSWLTRHRKCTGASCRLKTNNAFGLCKRKTCRCLFTYRATKIWRCISVWTDILKALPRCRFMADVNCWTYFLFFLFVSYTKMGNHLCSHSQCFGGNMKTLHREAPASPQVRTQNRPAYKETHCTTMTPQHMTLFISSLFFFFLLKCSDWQIVVV